MQSDPFGFDAFSSNKKEEPKKSAPPPRPALPRPKAATPTNEIKMQFNPDPFKMASSSASPGVRKKGERPKQPTPTEGKDPFAGQFSEQKFY